MVHSDVLCTYYQIPLIQRHAYHNISLPQADILSRDQYTDVVDERNIVGLCGYPLCPHKLGPVPTQRYRINVKRKQIIDITERKVRFRRLYHAVWS